MDEEIKKMMGVWNARPDDPFFDGHFPGRPILPAVATVQHAFQFLQEQLHAPELKLVEVKSAKFASPIVPNTQVQTTATQRKPNEWELELTEAGSQRELAQLYFVVA